MCDRVTSPTVFQSYRKLPEIGLCTIFFQTLIDDQPVYFHPCDQDEAYIRFAHSPISVHTVLHPTSNFDCTHPQEMPKLDIFLDWAPSVLDFTKDALGMAPIPGLSLIAGGLSEVCKRVNASSPSFFTLLNGHNRSCVVLNRPPARMTRRAKISCERHKACMTILND